MDCQGLSVFITGASSGIGRACAELFARHGARLLLCARRKDRLDEIADELSQTYQAEVYPLQLDVSNHDEVVARLEKLPKEWQDIDVLVNNAGLALALDTLQEGNPDDWNAMIDINVKGLLYVTQQVVANMIKRNKGHVINIGSISGYEVYSGGTVYCATKFAVRAISDGLKMDVHGTPIRVTLINPGMVQTEFSEVRFNGDQNRADQVYHGLNPLTPMDVADAIVYCATRPPHVDVREMDIFPTDQTAAHLFHRKPTGETHE